MANSVPVLSGLDASTTFLENTVNTTPQLIAASVSLIDPDNNFGGGALTVAGRLPEDIVSIRDQGAGAGAVGFSHGFITYGGVRVSAALGGVGETLTIVFTSAATTAAVDAVIENLTYLNSSDTPTASHTLTLGLLDGAGRSRLVPQSGLLNGTWCAPVRIHHGNQIVKSRRGTTSASSKVRCLCVLGKP